MRTEISYYLKLIKWVSEWRHNFYQLQR